MANGEELMASALAPLIEAMVVRLIPDRADRRLAILIRARDSGMLQKRRQGRGGLMDKVGVIQQADTLGFVLGIVQPGA
jgi:hypothetical protein